LLPRGLIRKLLVKFFTLISILILNNSLYAGLSDYIYPNSTLPSYSNYGSVGLIQMPTARSMPEGTLAFSWMKSDPYQRGSIVAYPFSWFEASYQYTDVNNALYSNIPSFSGGQTYKDKGFDAKFILLKENKYLPGVALGLRDLAGTGIFSSEYIVATKRFFNVDLTGGIGWGVLSANSINNPLIDIAERFKYRNVSDDQGGTFNTDAFFSGDAGYFAGLEFFIPNFRGMRFKLEYDGTDYTKEGFPYGESSFKFAFAPVKQPDSKFNYGVMYPISENVHLKLNYIKGNTINFGFSVQTNLGPKSPVIAKRDPVKNVPNASEFKERNSNDLDTYYKSALTFLGRNQLFLQNADVNKNTFSMTYVQSKHGSFARSSGRVMEILDQISPDEIEEFKISNLNGGMGMHEITINRKDYSQNKDSNLYKLATRNIKVDPYQYDPQNYEFQPEAKFPVFFWKVAPSLRSQIGGPDGFYFGDLRLAAHTETLFRRNISLITTASVGLVDNYDNLKLASDSVLPRVRTELVKYLKQSKDYSIRRAQLNVFFNPRKNLYAKFTAGIMEEMFGGYGGEVLFRPFNKSYGIGAELWRVKQRDFDQLFSFQDYETTTGHITFYYKEPRTQIITRLKGGRFLAEDSGINLEFSRRFKSGLRIGAFFSRTDISYAEFGEGSFDKGFFFFIPIESFFDEYSKGTSGFGLRPITRDGAAMLVHSHHLWGVTEQAQGLNITRDWDDLYD